MRKTPLVSSKFACLIFLAGLCTSGTGLYAQSTSNALATTSIKEIYIGQSKTEAIAATRRSFFVEPKELDCGEEAVAGMQGVERCWALTVSNDATYASIPLGAVGFNVHNDRVVRIMLLFGVPTQSKHRLLGESLKSVFGLPTVQNDRAWIWIGKNAVLWYQLGSINSATTGVPVELHLTEPSFMDALLASGRPGQSTGTSEPRRRKDM